MLENVNFLETSKIKIFSFSLKVRYFCTLEKKNISAGGSTKKFSENCQLYRGLIIFLRALINFSRNFLNSIIRFTLPLLASSNSRKVQKIFKTSKYIVEKFGKNFHTLKIENLKFFINNFQPFPKCRAR